MKEQINKRVHDFYWNEKLNCAETTLKTLSELFNIALNPQVMEAAIGMNGAGKFGSQCGLVEGTLIFISIYGSQKNIERKIIMDFCREFASGFQQNFSSLLCRKLRPQGFSSNDLPDICESITQLAVAYSAEFISEKMKLAVY